MGVHKNITGIAPALNVCQCTHITGISPALDMCGRGCKHRPGIVLALDASVNI